LCDSKAVLFISHRFSTVKSADRIVVLDEGKIVEQGTHAELIAHQGLYHELYSIQAAAYTDDVPVTSAS
jgi:ATP-binding cassette, subfamily B, bacterial